MGESVTEFVITRTKPINELSFNDKNKDNIRIKDIEVSSEASNALSEIYRATDKIVDICMNHPRMKSEFENKFAIEEGVVERKGENRVTVARTPEYLIENYKLVKESGVRDESWLVETSLENLVTWISLSAEANPAVLGEINYSLDLEQFGIQAERTLNIQRPKVLLSENEQTVPDNLFSEQLLDLRKRIVEKYGQAVCDSVVLCGGVARDIIQGKNPFTGSGDIDFAFTDNIDDQLREDITHEFTVGNINTPDDMTAKTGIFGSKMEREGWANIYDGLSNNVTFSIDSIAVNLGNGKVFDPNNGIDDLLDGRLKLVGKNKEEYLNKNPKKALILAIRGTRSYAQHGLIPDEETKKLFQATMDKNKIRNIFNLTTRGLNKVYGSYEIPIMYVKMLSKAQDALLISKGLDEFGILDQVSVAINALNRRSSINWNDKLLTIQDLLWQRDYKSFARGKMIGKHDIRHIDNKQQGIENARSISSSVMLARIFSFFA